MADEELLMINVWIAGRSYRIGIKPHEEETVRKAVKLADEKVMEMRNAYAGKDDQDFVAMTLLSYAADHTLDANQNPLFQNELSKMADRIDEILKKD